MKQDAYPLQWPAGWPRTKAHARERGQFDGTLDQIRAALYREIDAISLGRDARFYTIRSTTVISTNLPLRRDGEFMASARKPDDPGVAVYFTRKEKPLCFACDKYDEVWKNLRAIQKTIEAMRGIERWGSSTLLERAFTGFTALPEKSHAGVWETLGLDPDTATEKLVMDAWRGKAKTCHPDASGGSRVLWDELDAAKNIALATLKERSRA